MRYKERKAGAKNCRSSIEVWINITRKISMLISTLQPGKKTFFHVKNTGKSPACGDTFVEIKLLQWKRGSGYV
jgi:hypothetical protein